MSSRQIFFPRFLAKRRQLPSDLQLSTPGDVMRTSVPLKLTPWRWLKVGANASFSKNEGTCNFSKSLNMGGPRVQTTPGRLASPNLSSVLVGKPPSGSSVFVKWMTSLDRKWSKSPSNVNYEAEMSTRPSPRTHASSVRPVFCSRRLGGGRKLRGGNVHSTKSSYTHASSVRPVYHPL